MFDEEKEEKKIIVNSCVIYGPLLCGQLVYASSHRELMTI